VEQDRLSEANSSSPDQVHKTPLLDPILRPTSPLHTFKFYFFRIHFNIIPLLLLAIFNL